VVLADHTKCGEIGTNVFARLERVHTLIVDDGLAEPERALVAAAVGELRIAEAGAR
jgi:DeoR/GlpR family transcriptional regulator of sugar metabolism